MEAWFRCQGVPQKKMERATRGRPNLRQGSQRARRRGPNISRRICLIGLRESTRASPPQRSFPS